MPTPIVFSNATVIDGASPEAREGHHVLVEGGKIREVSDRPINSESARAIDLAGKTLMPGLVDCHVHVVAGLASFGGSADFPDSLVAARAAKIMYGMLMRGFTTVRDVGGADHGSRARRRGRRDSWAAACHFRQGTVPDRRARRFSRTLRCPPASAL